MRANDPNGARCSFALRGVMVVLAGIGALVFAGAAPAVPPTLATVGHQDRHPTASFSAPRASDVTIYLASKPDRGTDGRFLSENIEDLDFLTDSEIQTGRWLYEDQMDPGTYYVMLRATPDFASCYLPESGTYDPACADGFSAVSTLVIPKPTSRYTVRVQRYSFLKQFSFTLAATPLGEERPYRLCYRLKSKRKVCLRGTLSGYSWSSSASDTLSVSTRKLATMTTFTWLVGNSVVVKRTLKR